MSDYHKSKMFYGNHFFVMIAELSESGPDKKLFPRLNVFVIK